LDGGEDGVGVESFGDLSVEFLDFVLGIVANGFFELLLAKFQFAFLDSGHALAGGGVAEAAKHGVDPAEGVHVVFDDGASECELKGELFKSSKGAGGEIRGAVRGEFEDLAGGLVVLRSVFKEVGRSGAAHEALESVFVDGLVELLGSALGSFAVAERFNHATELLELGAGEILKAIDVGLHGISELGLRLCFERRRS
jgi:hypothetical protein